jgi:hypothetical protein
VLLISYSTRSKAVNCYFYCHPFNLSHYTPCYYLYRVLITVTLNPLVSLVLQNVRHRDSHVPHWSALFIQRINPWSIQSSVSPTLNAKHNSSNHTTLPPPTLPKRNQMLQIQIVPSRQLQKSAQPHIIHTGAWPEKYGTCIVIQCVPCDAPSHHYSGVVESRHCETGEGTCTAEGEDERVSTCRTHSTQ